MENLKGGYSFEYNNTLSYDSYLSWNVQRQVQLGVLGLGVIEIWITWMWTGLGD